MLLTRTIDCFGPLSDIFPDERTFINDGSSISAVHNRLVYSAQELLKLMSHVYTYCTTLVLWGTAINWKVFEVSSILMAEPSLRFWLLIALPEVNIDIK